MAIDWIRLNRSGWWLITSTVIPTLVVSAGALYFARYLGKQQAEIVLLRTQLAQTQESLNRCMGPSPSQPVGAP